MFCEISRSWLEFRQADAITNRTAQMGKRSRDELAVHRELSKSRPFDSVRDFLRWHGFGYAVDPADHIGEQYLTGR